MAMLEIHDNRGQVQYVMLQREHPMTFGSDPKCDIVLDDPDILPFHGRIRWKVSRFRVEAFPEAKYLRLNGKKFVQSSFRHGDEIRLGAIRLFLDNPEEQKGGDLEKTRVQVPPLGQPRSEPAPGRERSRPEEAAPNVFEAADPEPVFVEEEELNEWDVIEEETQVGPAPAALPRQSWWKRVMTAILVGDRPPGQERIATSPLVLSLLAALVILLGLGFALWGVIRRTIADRDFQTAMASLDDRDFRNAAHQFETFLQANPTDQRVSKARVLRAMASVKQYAMAAPPVWSLALQEAHQAFTQVSREPAFRDSSTELAELTVRIAEGLADRARDTTDPKVLAEAEDALSLHQQIAGPKLAAIQITRSRLPTKLADARAAVTKAQTRIKILADMDQALKDRSSTGVYAARDTLVAQYADLATDSDVIKRLTQANDLIREAATFDPARRPAQTEPRTDPLGPPVSRVLRSETSAGSAGGPLVFALADGFAYGLDGSTGAPLWHSPVGLTAPFAPQPISGTDSDALLFDARSHELTRIKSRTGALVWRQDLGEPIDAPPLVLGSTIAQATPGGRLLILDLRSGEIRGTLDLKRPLTRTPVADETGQFFYVLGREANLFVVARDPMACARVEYLGHAAGSIPCGPVRIGRYLVVVENSEPADGRWTVLLLDEEGPGLHRVQQLPITGWTWETPEATGQLIWATGDRAAVTAYAMGGYDQKDPFRIIARTPAVPAPSGPTFALARTETDLWVASAQSARYELNADRGSLATQWTLVAAGPARGPIQVAGNLEVLTQQNQSGPGIALWGVRPADGSVAWQTVLGPPWPADLTALADGSGLTTLGADGRAITIPRQWLSSGGFVVEALPRPGRDRLPPGPLRRLEMKDLGLVIPGSEASYILVREGSDSFRRIDLPAPLAAPPVLWGPDLFIPGDGGRAYLIDPRTGAPRAEPFVPPFDRSEPTRWRAPVTVEGAVVLADNAGRVRRLVRTDDDRPRLVIDTEVALGKPLAADPASTGNAVLLATQDGQVRALAGRDLSPQGAWPLEAPRALGPLAVGDLAFVADTSGHLLAFGPDGGRLWTIDLHSAPPEGPPVIQGDSVLLLGGDGVLSRLALSDGTREDRFDLGTVPAGGLVVSGDGVVVPVGLGTVRLLNPTGAGETP